MSGRNLPDDVSLWPTNPYELLGVSPHNDARVARRAYLGLVRRFKPEHAPEQFKRIREAYEFVEKQIQARELYQSAWNADDAEENHDDWTFPHQTSQEDDPPYVAEVADRDLEGGAPAPRGQPLLAPDAESRCTTIWNDLEQGCDLADAYARLVRIHQERGGSGEACLRLYWLTFAAPEVDPDRGPAYWLTEGLRVSRLEGRLRELYRRELNSHPHEAANERCTALLRLDVPLGPLVDLTEWRWRALGRIGRWDMVLTDLAELRPRIVFDEEEAWGRLLLVAIDQLAWSESPKAQQAADACRRELGQMSHLHSTFDREWDRLDLLWDVAAGWRRLRMNLLIPRHWTDLLPLSWTREYHRIRPKLVLVLRDIAHDPFRALDVMDEMARHSAAAVAQLGFTIEAYRYAEERYEYDPRTDDELKTLVRKFLNGHDNSNYRSIRRSVLQFCLVEAIEPQRLAQFADAILAGSGVHANWQDVIAEDGPLRFVYAGHRAF